MSGLRIRHMRWSVGSAAFGLAAGALVFAFSSVSTAPAQDGGVGPFFTEPVVRVEEDWMLVLNEPDGNVDSPQFHTVMSPFSDASSFFAQVLWNYRETPDFVTGGVQLPTMVRYTVGWTLRRRAQSG